MALQTKNALHGTRIAAMGTKAKQTLEIFP